MAEETPPPQSAQAASGAAPPRMAPLAIVSVVLGVLSFLCVPILPVIPAIVCGHVAWSKINKSGGALSGKGIAIVGLIVGYLAIPWAVLQVWFLAGMFQGESHRLHDLAVEKKEITSEDGKLKITTSGFWVKRSDLNAQASLQAGCKRDELYLMVISDAKTAVGNMNLEQHHQRTRDRMLAKMSNTSATQPVSVTIDGHAALQDEISGTNERTDLVFLHTTVDEGGSFDQILAWTSKSHWPKHNAELREVTGTFRREQ